MALLHMPRDAAASRAARGLARSWEAAGISVLEQRGEPKAVDDLFFSERVAGVTVF